MAGRTSFCSSRTNSQRTRSYMGGRDVRLLIAKDRGSTPVLRELVGSASYTDAPPANIALFAKGLDAVLDVRLSNGYADWAQGSQSYGAALIEVWSGQVSADVGSQKANAADDTFLGQLVRN